MANCATRFLSRKLQSKPSPIRTPSIVHFEKRFWERILSNMKTFQTSDTHRRGQSFGVKVFSKFKITPKMSVCSPCKSELSLGAGATEWHEAMAGRSLAKLNCNLGLVLIHKRFPVVLCLTCHLQRKFSVT